MCGANKLTGKMELVLLLSSCSSLFSHVLFSAMFSCFLLDSYELQEIILMVLINMVPLSLLSTSRGVLATRVLMNMLAIRFFFLMLETEESVSEIDSHHILQAASEL